MLRQVHAPVQRCQQCTACACLCKCCATWIPCRSGQGAMCGQLPFGTEGRWPARQGLPAGLRARTMRRVPHRRPDTRACKLQSTGPAGMPAGTRQAAGRHPTGSSRAPPDRRQGATCSVSRALSVGTNVSSCGTYAQCRLKRLPTGRPFIVTCTRSAGGSSSAAWSRLVKSR